MVSGPKFKPKSRIVLSTPHINCFIKSFNCIFLPSFFYNLFTPPYQHFPRPLFPSDFIPSNINTGFYSNYFQDLRLKSKLGKWGNGIEEIMLDLGAVITKIINGLLPEMNLALTLKLVTFSFYLPFSFEFLCLMKCYCRLYKSRTGFAVFLFNSMNLCY